MSNFYKRVPEDTIHKNNHSLGLKTTIIKFAAGFSIAIYKGRLRVVYVYRSPYQRKYYDYTSLKQEKTKRVLSEFSDEATLMLELEELELMQHYKPIFDDILEVYPKPSYPINSL